MGINEEEFRHLGWAGCRFLDVDEATAPRLASAMETQDAADPTLYHLPHMQVGAAPTVLLNLRTHTRIP
jgi:hypothetical protein